MEGTTVDCRTRSYEEATNKDGNKNLGHSLIIRGIPEEFKENGQMICEKIHCILSTIMHGVTDEEKLASAKQLVINNCHRLGRFS